jgi:hypothetical protein
MELPLISEFLELLQKVDGFQEKLFEKNKVLGLLSLKAILKILEGLTKKLKEKHDKIVEEDMENLIPGIKLSKIKDLFSNKIKL